MRTKTVDIHKPANLAELASLAKAGTEIILAENGAPLARIIPIADRASARVAGLHPNASQTTDDFDEPLPDAFWSRT